MSSRLAVLSLMALANFTACQPPPDEAPGLAPPSEEARRAASEFKREHPQARIFFSQRTGQILWIDGGGAPLFPDRAGAVASGRALNAEEAKSAVQAFMLAYPALFRIASPKQTIHTAPEALTDTGWSNGVVSLRFVQTQNAMPIRGKYGMALFDARGNLVSLAARLMPTDQFQPDPEGGESIAASSQALALSDEWAGKLAPLKRRHAWEAGPAGKFRVVEERVERDGISVTRTLRDPRTGRIIRSIDETPSELVEAPSRWKDLPPSEARARDALGNVLSIPSTPVPGAPGSPSALVLGFSLPGILAKGQGVSVADSGNLELRSLIPSVPLATNSADWVAEPAYDADLRAATRLSAHLRTVLHWYAERLGHRSWDGNGAGFRASVRGHRSKSDKPDLNAWGGGGMLLVGDGASETGQPISDSLDVVGHEFTHSVINATADFEYHDEPGALNESLADFFGKAIEGYADPIVGSGAGARLRDIADPAACGPLCAQPATYGDFRFLDPEATDYDHGGVHLNSGILNRALSQVVRLGWPGAAAGPADRAAALAALILGALKELSFPTDTSLEEFGASLSAYCHARSAAGTLSGGADLCARIESALSSVELLGSPL